MGGAAPARARDELGKNQIGQTPGTHPAAGITAMPFLPSLVNAKYESGYRIHLTFNDGLEATVDFEEWLIGPMFEPVRARRYFSRFFIEGGGVAWPNGADIAPETLYKAALERSNTRLDPTAAVREKRPKYRTAKRRRG